MCMDCLQMVRHIYQKSQVCCYGPHVYCTSSTVKNKDKRHCACAWTDLQMLGHISPTTMTLLWSTCILRFIYGKTKDKTPLRYCVIKITSLLSPRRLFELSHNVIKMRLTRFYLKWFRTLFLDSNPQDTNQEDKGT